MSEGPTMGARSLDPDLVRRICGLAAGEVVYDALDDSIWVHMPTAARAGLALNSLNAYGIGGHDLEDGRLHVTGWNGRLLHWRLGGLLAGVDDLRSEWAGTAELVYYHYDRRIAADVEADWAEVLADVESVIRSCVPIPHQAPAPRMSVSCSSWSLPPGKPTSSSSRNTSSTPSRSSPPTSIATVPVPRELTNCDLGGPFHPHRGIWRAVRGDRSADRDHWGAHHGDPAPSDRSQGAVVGEVHLGRGSFSHRPGHHAHRQHAGSANDHCPATQRRRSARPGRAVHPPRLR